MAQHFQYLDDSLSFWTSHGLPSRGFSALFLPFFYDFLTNNSQTHINFLNQSLIFPTATIQNDIIICSNRLDRHLGIVDSTAITFIFSALSEKTRPSS